MVQQFEKEGLECIRLSNNHLEVIIMPGLGGKMISLRSKASRTEFLLPNQHPLKTYRPAKPGSDFSLFDVSAFDDCFPNVKPETVVWNQQEINLPDHGEWWCRPWSYKLENDVVTLEMDGLCWGYSIKKIFHLKSNILEINYLLRNTSSSAFPYLWSAHPLLRVEEGDRLIFPAEMDTVDVYWSSDEALFRTGSTLGWPLNNGIDFSKVPSHESGWTCKLFSRRLINGMAGLQKRRSGEQLQLRFNPAENPYLGLWLCYGGWPIDRFPRHYTLAVEPTNGSSDSLKDLMISGQAPIIGPYQEITWKLELMIGAGVNGFK